MVDVHIQAPVYMLGGETPAAAVLLFKRTSCPTPAPRIDPLTPDLRWMSLEIDLYELVLLFSAAVLLPDLPAALHNTALPLPSPVHCVFVAFLVAALAFPRSDRVLCCLVATFPL